MAYLSSSMGPGGIAQMAPSHGLSTKPTIGMNLTQDERHIPQSRFSQIQGDLAGMGAYLQSTVGPGGIAQLAPTYGLSTKPTIGMNLTQDERRIQQSSFAQIQGDLAGMGSYQQSTVGPGGIAQLAPTYGLSTNPTIGMNLTTDQRSIPQSRFSSIQGNMPGMSGCGCGGGCGGMGKLRKISLNGLGTGETGSFSGLMGVLLLLGVLGAGLAYASSR